MNPEFSPKSDYCESLTVHVAQWIQPSGVFVAIDPTQLTVRLVSSNFESVFGPQENSLVGKHVRDIISQTSLIKINQQIRWMSDSSTSVRCVIDIETLNSAQPKHCLSFFSGNLFCLEFQTTELDSTDLTSLIQESRNVIEQIMLFEGSIHSLTELVCSSVRKLTGFQRVYYCRFEEDGHGFVPADDAVAPLESITNHHFPAADVPQVVRKLYLKSRYRIIPDAAYVPIPILEAEANLDLSQSLLRAIGPTHLEYLKNMGVRSSASFSVVEGSVLRGLIGCHSTQPSTIPFALLPQIQLIVEAFAARLITDKLNHLNIERPQFDSRILSFVSTFTSLGCELVSLPHDSFLKLMNSFESDSAIYCKNSIQKNVGKPIDSEFANAFCKFVANCAEPSEVFATGQLGSLDPQFQKWEKVAAGALYIPLGSDGSEFLAFFRP